MGRDVGFVLWDLFLGVRVSNCGDAWGRRSEWNGSGVGGVDRAGGDRKYDCNQD